MKVSLIVAAAENEAIGFQGDLPWRLPEDLKRFRTLTTGHHIIMGRRTWDSIGRPLPNRTNLVLSRARDLSLDGARVHADLAAALSQARKAGETETFIIGGASLYAEALPLADKIYLTRVHARPQGDVFLPALFFQGFKEISREPQEADRQHSFSFTFITLTR